MTDLEKLLHLLLKPDVQAALLGPPGPPPNLSFIERGGDHVESDLQLLLNRVMSLLGDALESEAPLARIIISGPGGVINGPLMIIQQSLESFGYKVDVENAQPIDSVEEYAYLKRILKANEEKQEAPSRIRIKMNHQPWGG